VPEAEPLTVVEGAVPAAAEALRQRLNDYDGN
jgi:hypothetical protein